MTGRLEWPDPTPDGPTPEEERQMDAERECQRCDGSGRIEVFRCAGVCECGDCPEIDDCPECCGQIECDDDCAAVYNAFAQRQERLGAEFEAAIFSDIESLYEA